MIEGEMNQYNRYAGICKLSVCISKNVRCLSEQVKRVTHDQFHVFTIFKCDYNAGVTIIIYLFNVV